MRTATTQSCATVAFVVGQMRYFRAILWMDDVKDWTPLAHARTGHDGLPQWGKEKKKLEENLCRIVPHASLTFSYDIISRRK